MMNPTPVTTSSMTSESGSSTEPKSTWSGPAEIHAGAPGSIHGSASAPGQTDERHHRLRQPASQESIDKEPEEGQQRYQRQYEQRFVHSFIRSIRSTASVARARKMAMMMASPTAASAAATTMTKNTKIWPFTRCHWCAKVTNERFTPLSMSSIDMKTVIRLRLIRNPITPRLNRAALKSRYQEVGIICSPSLLRFQREPAPRRRGSR